MSGVPHQDFVSRKPLIVVKFVFFVLSLEPNKKTQDVNQTYNWICYKSCKEWSTNPAWMLLL